jgi:hypothetical protein
MNPFRGYRQPLKIHETIYWPFWKGCGLPGWPLLYLSGLYWTGFNKYLIQSVYQVRLLYTFGVYWRQRGKKGRDSSFFYRLELVREAKAYCHNISYSNVPALYVVSQCCGSGWFLTGSGSNFWKLADPDPDPGLNKLSAKFLMEIFWRKYAQKVYRYCIYEPKS